MVLIYDEKRALSALILLSSYNRASGYLRPSVLLRLMEESRLRISLWQSPSTAGSFCRF
jgi:hypothetical protein